MRAALQTEEEGHMTITVDDYEPCTLCGAPTALLVCQQCRHEHDNRRREDAADYYNQIVGAE